jgi:hypothetical protein
MDQMDQMLYRDIDMLPSQSLTVSFLYRTRMSNVDRYDGVDAHGLVPRRSARR